ncbi:hypothetical protein A2875_04845 [Candidatus Gottesmanbacteria bacterium RIFCSPHIGHO2_01_FULL_46_14]|uniref:Polymerase beta nucleotidyltransferase domain-containing protein n=3 Tax=Candidatus Gottesmaniibacteriota TaxID=1752720 RepID=A0A1F5ZNY5_9BACT|nr:MAG: Nucleotidyltransferase [Candidatus Gottesmanbacteria bacterium GW2011_GWA1_47_8]OGG14189.1 MAG: hypothetical protein A2875_04845 [Candidatus Gottesmanbacteria bacterium RIFCSPHIGHO2_01_FULL_46_14]OGG29434.1 MAG: hypothetical protein A2971_02595 [Candidatus Gottesmanbacteria bacterium RIFCSPLOWO2_01_FULL_46_21]
MKHPDEALLFIKKTLRTHLPDPSYRFFLFGSRVTGYARRFSDFDIGIEGETPVSPNTMGVIKEELEESNLPYKVDIVDFSTVDPEFRNLALKHTQYL